MELHRWRQEEERRLEEARTAEEAARATAELEKARYKSAIENAEAAQRVAEIESQRRVEAEKDNGLIVTPLRYRRYTIEEIEEATDYFHESRKIGEGGYGPVYKCSLDHTPVAVKVLRPDAAQGRSQFNQEVRRQRIHNFSLSLSLPFFVFLSWGIGIHILATMLVVPLSRSVNLFLYTVG